MTSFNSDGVGFFPPQTKTKQSPLGNVSNVGT